MGGYTFAMVAEYTELVCIKIFKWPVYTNADKNCDITVISGLL